LIVGGDDLNRPSLACTHSFYLRLAAYQNVIMRSQQHQQQRFASSEVEETREKSLSESSSWHA